MSSDSSPAPALQVQVALDQATSRRRRRRFRQTAALPLLGRSPAPTPLTSRTAQLVPIPSSACTSKSGDRPSHLALRGYRCVEGILAVWLVGVEPGGRLRSFHEPAARQVHLQ